MQTDGHASGRNRIHDPGERPADDSIDRAITTIGSDQIMEGKMGWYSYL
jgi:hypothetical protein